MCFEGIGTIGSLTGTGLQDCSNKRQSKTSKPQSVLQSLPFPRSLGDTQRQAQELISGPSLGAKTKFMSF